jgi:hypothetical protein
LIVDAQPIICRLKERDVTVVHDGKCTLAA